MERKPSFWEKVGALKERYEDYQEKRWAHQAERAKLESARLRAENEREHLKAQIARSRAEQQRYGGGGRMAGFTELMIGRPQERRESPRRKREEKRDPFEVAFKW